MATVHGGTSWWFRARIFVPGVLCVLLAGCALGHHQVDKAMQTENGSAARSTSAVDRYCLACPDVLELHIETRPDLSGQRAIGVDGRIDLGEVGRLRVEGLTVQETADTLARLLDLSPARVRVSVVKFNSQQVYLFGEVEGLQRAVAYQGPETVADLLQ